MSDAPTAPGSTEPAPSVRYALTDADQLALAWDKFARSAAIVVMLFAVIGAGLAATGRGPLGTRALIGLIPVCAIVGIQAWTWFRTRSAVLAEIRRRTLHGSEITLTARAEGLEITGVERSLHAWSLVGVPSLTRSAVTLPVGHTTKLLVPRRLFAAPEDERRFLEAIRVGRTSPPAALPMPEDDGPFAYDLAFESGRDDLIALNRWFLDARTPAPWWRGPLFGAMTLVSLLAVVANPAALVATMLLGGLTFVATRPGRALLVRWRVWRLLRNGGHEAGTVLFRARPEGIVYRGRSVLRASWAAVIEIVDAPEHVFLFNGPASAWIVPKAVLGTRAEAFVADAHAWKAAAVPYARPPAPKAEPVDSTNPFAAPRGEP